jgi:regulatory protein
MRWSGQRGDSLSLRKARNRSNDFEAAKAYAFLLLKFRLRSEGELESRLKRKKFSPEVVKKTASFLKEKKFIDDVLFARGWIQSRLRRSLGARRITTELKLKGINKEIIERELSLFKENYSEQEVVTRLAEERLKKLKTTEPRSAMRRVYAYLARRGFSPEIITDVLHNLCRQTS